MKRRYKPVFVLLLIVAILAACSPAATETPPPETPTEAVVMVPTDTLTPTETTAPATALLLANESADVNRVNEALNALQQAANERGLSVEQRAELSPESAPGNLQLVVVLPPYNDLGPLAGALPNVQFVAVGFSGLEAGANLTVIESGSTDANLAFMSGYVAAVQSDEWRIGIISASDANGQIYREAFLNGAVYFCGNCTPIYPPFEGYPLYAEASVGASEAELEMAAEPLLARGVNMMHVAPGLQSEEFYRFLAQRGVQIVGSAAPPAGLEGNWIASVMQASQTSLGEIINQVLTSGAQGKIGSSIQFGYTSASQARIDGFVEVLGRLESGEIDPVGAVN